MILSMLLFRTMSAAPAEYVKINDVKAFSEALAARTSALTSISAEVTQKKYLSVFNAEVISKGTFAWSSPDKLCLD